MSLTIYSAFHKPPKEVNVISQNDVYFDGLTGLTGNEVEAKILSTRAFKLHLIICWSIF